MSCYSGWFYFFVSLKNNFYVGKRESEGLLDERSNSILPCTMKLGDEMCVSRER